MAFRVDRYAQAMCGAHALPRMVCRGDGASGRGQGTNSAYRRWRLMRDRIVGHLAAACSRGVLPIRPIFQSRSSHLRNPQRRFPLARRRARVRHKNLRDPLSDGLPCFARVVEPSPAWQYCGVARAGHVYGETSSASPPVSVSSRPQGPQSRVARVTCGYATEVYGDALLGLLHPFGIRARY